MRSNSLLKFFCSIPIILIISYYIPFIGVLLIVTRYFVYSNNKLYFTPLMLIITGVLFLIPIIINEVLNVFKIENMNIPYLSVIINSKIYDDLINYSKFLISVGIVFLVISLVFKNLFNKLSNYIRLYLRTREQIDADNRKKNDMEIKIKQEKAQNTQVINCPYCGADNILFETVGTCKYCRRSLNNKK